MTRIMHAKIIDFEDHERQMDDRKNFAYALRIPPTCTPLLRGNNPAFFESRPRLSPAGMSAEGLIALTLKRINPTSWKWETPTFWAASASQYFSYRYIAYNYGDSKRTVSIEANSVQSVHVVLIEYYLGLKTLSSWVIKNREVLEWTPLIIKDFKESILEGRITV